MIRALVGVLSLLAASAAWAQAPARPAVGPERPFSPVSRTERTLANGLQVIVARRPTVPKMTASLTIRTGLAADPADAAGLAGVVAETIQEGTKRRESRRIRREVFGMGGSLSAGAGQDATFITVRGLSEFMPGLLDLMADVVVNPTFPEQELAIVKANRLQGLKQEQASPQAVSNREFRRALFGPHQYARTTPTPESIGAIDRARLVAFHETYYRPNHAFLLIVGDMEPAAAFAAAEKAFGGWPRKDVPPPTFAAVPEVRGRHLVFVQRPNSVQSSMSVGNLAVKRSDPRWFDLTVANTIYGGAFNSRIVRNIREQKGYTYSPGSLFVAFSDAGYYRFSADTRNEVTGPTLKEVFSEFDIMRASGAEGAELEGAKQYLRGIFVIRAATQSGFANLLADQYLYGLPRDYVETYQARISGVTPERVRAAAGTLFSLENSIVVVVGDYPKVKGQLTGFASVTFLDVEGRKIPEPLESK